MNQQMIQAKRYVCIILTIILLISLWFQNAPIAHAITESKKGDISYTFEEQYQGETQSVRINIIVWGNSSEIEIEEISLAEGTVLDTYIDDTGKTIASYLAHSAGKIDFKVRYTIEKVKQTEGSHELAATPSDSTPSDSKADKLWEVDFAVGTPSNAGMEDDSSQLSRVEKTEVITYDFQPKPRILAAGDVELDVANFPNDAFRGYLKKNFDANNDDILSQAEIETITMIDVSNDKTITSLKGVEYLTGLKSLEANGNKLTTLDLSANINLWELECSENELTELNVVGCVDLYKLNCNGNQLEQLDLTGITKLRNLNCDSNLLTELNLGSQPSLTTVNASQNQLTSIKVENVPSLVTLRISNNKFTMLDLTPFSKLKTLMCDSNELTELDLSSLRVLEMFSCSKNQLTRLDVSGNSRLLDLTCNDNKITTITGLGNCRSLESLIASNNCLTELDLRSFGNSHFMFLSLGKQNPEMKVPVVQKGDQYEIDLNGLVTDLTRVKLRMGSTAAYDSTTGIITTNQLEETMEYFYGTGGGDMWDSIPLSILVTFKLNIHTVTFNSQGGSEIPSVRGILDNTKVSKPATDPTKPGARFDGWYREAECRQQWNFDVDTVTADMILYAKWTDYYTVTFDSQGGGVIPPITGLTVGTTISKPEKDPVKIGMNFGGWYKEKEGITPWDFKKDTVIGDTTLYAKWSKLHTVTFDSKGGSAVEAITGISDSSTIAKPADPVRSGYRFDGWYREPEYKITWNFTTDKVESDLTLYAKWKRNSSGGGGGGNGGGGKPVAPPITPETTPPETTPPETTPPETVAPETVPETIPGTVLGSNPQLIPERELQNAGVIELPKEIPQESESELSEEDQYKIVVTEVEKESRPDVTDSADQSLQEDSQANADELPDSSLGTDENDRCWHLPYFIILLIVWSVGGYMLIAERKKVKKAEDEYDLNK